MCFSSVSVWWLPCGAKQGFVAGWPTWTGTYVSCKCKHVFDLLSSDLTSWFMDTSHFSQAGHELHQSLQLHKQDLDMQCSIKKRHLSKAWHASWVEPELTGARFLEFTST